MRISLSKFPINARRTSGAGGPALAVSSGAIHWADPREGHYNDLSGSGHTVTLHGASTPTIDPDGIAPGLAGLTLNGTDQYVTSDAGADLAGIRKEYTFSGIYEGGARGDCYFSTMNSTVTSLNQNGYCIWKGSADTFRNHRGGTIVESGTPTTSPVHMVWKYWLDGATLKLDMFQDGVKVINGSTSNSGGDFATDCLGIGVICDLTPSSWWAGNVGETILYNRALSDAEIADIYAKAQTDWGV